MFTEHVLFDLPPGLSREEVVHGMEAVAPRWRAGLKARYGCEPLIRWYETPLVVDTGHPVRHEAAAVGR
ncbi:MAG: hypothetical protein Fur0014_22600 [Rubrivivax sp.]